MVVKPLSKQCQSIRIMPGICFTWLGKPKRPNCASNFYPCVKPLLSATLFRNYLNLPVPLLTQTVQLRQKQSNSVSLSPSIYCARPLFPRILPPWSCMVYLHKIKRFLLSCVVVVAVASHSHPGWAIRHKSSALDFRSPRKTATTTRKTTTTTTIIIISGCETRMPQGAA